MSTIVDRLPARWTALRLERPRLWGAGLVGYAGVLHWYAAPEHYDAWWGYGAFFVGVGLLQVVLAVGLLKIRSDTMAVATGVSNLLIVVLYVFSRTKGIPIGPEVGHPGTHRTPEAFGILDLACAAAEVAGIVLLASTAGRTGRRVLIDAAFLCGAGLWCLRLLGQLNA